ncbi:hypothetical protein HD553DRAFT_314688 [Filobasidium floriforme]|uniref:uncharacterized protein n=1 Tax=Filobasidium floriforme TaxID=5210 RepID=UPI001E8E363C|nr:uncharacterized protein HD553DRAFT_314688 [Filobasidium floriforme]KAH8082354.1 hypothetical protein HD553DRAFT_314688 [Filobasidium floriforme]
MPYHHLPTTTSSGKPRSSGSLKSLILSTICLGLLCLSSGALARSGEGEGSSVAEQFGLHTAQGDVSHCWKQCNHDVTESIPAPWTHETNLNQWSFISKNCLYDVYLETMAKCLVVKCESSWDVQYAVEYGEGMCKKAGHEVQYRLPPTYTETAGGYFATAIPRTLSARANSSPRDTHARSGSMGSVGVVVGIIFGISLLGF